MRDEVVFRRETPCLDFAGRDRTLAVLVTAGGLVALHVPAGEVAFLPPSSVEAFQAVVTEAHFEAVKVRTP
jgi:hypothetical protein